MRENRYVLSFSLKSCSGAILINTGRLLQSFGAATTKVWPPLNFSQTWQIFSNLWLDDLILRHFTVLQIISSIFISGGSWVCKESWLGDPGSEEALSYRNSKRCSVEKTDQLITLKCRTLGSRGGLKGLFLTWLQKYPWAISQCSARFKTSLCFLG